MKRAVFPGSFDPITKGHESIVQRALPLFDEIVIAVGHNSTKQTTFSLESRIKMLQAVFKNEPKISIDQFSGLTVDYCKQKDIAFIIRGLRTSSDFNYERSIAQMNRALNPSVDTVLIICEPAYSAISSTIVRDIIKHGGDAQSFLPDGLQYEKYLH